MILSFILFQLFTTLEHYWENLKKYFDMAFFPVNNVYLILVLLA